MNNQNVYLSVIIPIFNEQENIRPLVNKTMSVLKKLNKTWEIICVNDGSKDKTGQILNQIAQNNKEIKIIHFIRNFGQTAAIKAGVNNTLGKIIVLLDADLQNDPEDIPKLLQKINQGYDVVSGWRKNRKDSPLRVLPSIIANKIISHTTGVYLHDTGCTLKAYKKEVIANLPLYGEMHRFLPALAVSTNGAKITEVKINHHPRIHGKSKYTLLRTFKVILDLLTVKFFGSFSTKPIYVFGGGGFFLLLMGITAFAFVIIRKLFFQGVWVSPMLFIAVLLLTVSVQLILMGLLEEIMIRTYFASSNQQTYKIKKQVNF